MSLIQRERRGVPKQKQPRLKWSEIHHKKEIALTLFCCATMILGALFVCGFIGRPPWKAPRVVNTRTIERERAEQASTRAGELYGIAMGHLIGQQGKPFPLDTEIERMAKTQAVDAGTSVNDFIFTSAYKSAFGKAYREGRLKSRQ